MFVFLAYAKHDNTTCMQCNDSDYQCQIQQLGAHDAEIKMQSRKNLEIIFVMVRKDVYVVLLFLLPDGLIFLFSLCPKKCTIA